MPLCLLVASSGARPLVVHAASSPVSDHTTSSSPVSSHATASSLVSGHASASLSRPSFPSPTSTSSALSNYLRPSSFSFLFVFIHDHLLQMMIWKMD